jgi:hypothetical protein
MHPIDFIATHIKIVLLLMPLLAVLWECGIVAIVGYHRVWRRFGMAAYISGFVMLLGSIYDFNKASWDDTLALIIFTLVIAVGMPFVALLIRENQAGDLEMKNGPWLTRFIGIAVYVFCLLTILTNNQPIPRIP